MSTPAGEHFQAYSKQTTCAKYVRGPVSSLSTERFRRRNLSRVLERPLDRVNVLGNDALYGHSG